MLRNWIWRKKGESLDESETVVPPKKLKFTPHVKRQLFILSESSQSIPIHGNIWGRGINIDIARHSPMPVRRARITDFGLPIPGMRNSTLNSSAF